MSKQVSYKVYDINNEKIKCFLFRKETLNEFNDALKKYGLFVFVGCNQYDPFKYMDQFGKDGSIENGALVGFKGKQYNVFTKKQSDYIIECRENK